MKQTLDKLANQTLKFILPLTAFLVPLFFLSLTPSYFSFNKRYLIFFLASISLLAFSLRSLTRQKLQFTVSPASTPILILVAVYLISSVVQAPNTTQSLFGQTSLIAALAIIFFTTTSSQKNTFVVKSTITALISSGFIVSLIAIYQALGISAKMSLPAFMQSKIFNPTGGPLPFLTLALPLIPATIYLGLKTNQWLNKFLIFAVATAFTIASIFQINFLLPSTPEASLVLLPLSAGWSIAVDVFKNWRTALLGTGPGTFLSAFTKLRPNNLNYLPIWNTRFSNSSNELLTILTTTGLLGFSAFVSAFIKTISVSRKSLSGSINKNPLHVFSNLILIFSFIALIIVPGNPLLFTLCFISLSLVVLNLKLSDHPQTKDVVINLLASPKNSLQTNSKANAILPWVYVSFNIVLLGFFWFFAGRIYAAALVTKKAITSLNTEGIKSYNYQAQAYSLDPTNPTYRINFSQTSLALANSLAQKKDLSDQDKQDLNKLVEQSIREAKNATRLDPQNVVVWQNLAAIYRQLLNFAKGASDWSIASYSQAINLDPTNPVLRLDLGGVLLTLKDYQGAIKLFEQAIERKSDWPNAHYNLATVYKINKDYSKALAEMRIVVQLIDPNSSDYQKAQDELKELEKLAPPPPSKTGQKEAKSSSQGNSQQDVQLVTPTPLPSPQEQVNLPENSGPEIPPTPTEEVTPSITPTPTPTP